MSRGPYGKSAEARRRILDACVEAFGRTGFHGATMREVARRAGVSQTGLMHHFPRKEDLLLAMLELRDRRSTAFLESAAALDPSARPLAALRGMLAVLVENELQPGLMEVHCVLSGEATQATTRRTPTTPSGTAGCTGSTPACSPRSPRRGRWRWSRSCSPR
ncbi:TetR/AcrR family transcriptional regulator [Streptomyces griseorubiginosus]|uniref:TetR/AcrR family transcriptional regulator n=1 Tax=Streptomyces griseorubiginosus TaxID=67304 RepID=UPI0015E85169|nr:TetR/AcrR family transcriptional regulator [Streptomyces griseorubiginosus]